MRFTESQKKIFKKNLKAIEGSKLEKEFKLITKPKEFALHFGGDSLDINIECHKRFIYQNALAELTDKVALYQNKYILYPYLYFYGFGNGLLYKVLLQNERLEKLIVFEKSPELLWLIFHIIDFSKELKAQRLVISKDFEKERLWFDLYFRDTKVGNYAKTYFLEPHSLYYEENFGEDILKTNKSLAQLIRQAILEYGNAPPDALIGLENRAQNFAAQLTHPTANEFKKRVNLAQTAICVATGPSLTKQLPLLKAVQEKVAIFSADSAYPILMQNDIVPDYVFMLERTDFTAEFFKHDFKGKDKDTVFVICDVVHPNAIKYLDKFKRNYTVVRKALYTSYIKMKRYMRLGGFSVAESAIELACNFLYKNIILIGQDLAYAKSGASHAKSYQNDEFYESRMYEKERIEVEAYGGKGVVQTHHIWLMFKNNIEFIIQQLDARYDGFKIYNCTEGGARIKHAIEMPFKKACDKFLKNAPKKHFEPLNAPPKEKQCEYLLGVYARLKKQILKSEDFAQECYYKLENLRNVFEVLKKVNSTSFETNKPYFEECDKIITQIKDELEDKEKSICVYEICSPTIFQFEQNMSALYVYNPQSESEKNEKMFLWISKHLQWLEQLIISSQTQKITLENSLAPLQKAIKKAGKDAEKKMKMIDEKDRGCFMFL